MSENARLWKFWIWEIVLAVLLLALGAAALLYTPELAGIVRSRRLEIQLLALLLAIVITVVAYRLATGALVGVVKWFVRLLGSGLVVAFLILLPVLASWYVLKPEYFSAASPFVALFVLWCLYGIIFLIKWQTRLFYQLVNAVRKRGHS
jgi:hypothetical protein